MAWYCKKKGYWYNIFKKKMVSSLFRFHTLLLAIVFGWSSAQDYSIYQKLSYTLSHLTISGVDKFLEQYFRKLASLWYDSFWLPFLLLKQPSALTVQHFLFFRVSWCLTCYIGIFLMWISRDQIQWQKTSQKIGNYLAI